MLHILIILRLALLRPKRARGEVHTTGDRQGASLAAVGLGGAEQKQHHNEGFCQGPKTQTRLYMMPKSFRIRSRV